MADNKVAIKTFSYKIRPNRKFIAACEQTPEHCRQLYNAALAERIDSYKVTGKSLNYWKQSRHLTEALPATGEAVGSDVGIRCFAVLSTGEKIENPRPLKKAEKGLKKQQRSRNGNWLSRPNGFQPCGVFICQRRRQIILGRNAS